MSVTSIVAAVAVVVLIIVLLRARAASVESSLPDPETATDADLRHLLLAGRKIDAIKVYRRLHRVDLKAAKEAVERMAGELTP